MSAPARRVASRRRDAGGSRGFAATARAATARLGCAVDGVCADARAHPRCCTEKWTRRAFARQSPSHAVVAASLPAARRRWPPQAPYHRPSSGPDVERLCSSHTNPRLPKRHARQAIPAGTCGDAVRLASPCHEQPVGEMRGMGRVRSQRATARSIGPRGAGYEVDTTVEPNVFFRPGSAPRHGARALDRGRIVGKITALGGSATREPRAVMAEVTPATRSPR